MTFHKKSRPFGWLFKYKKVILWYSMAMMNSFHPGGK